MIEKLNNIEGNQPIGAISWFWSTVPVSKEKLSFITANSSIELI